MASDTVVVSAAAVASYFFRFKTLAGWYPPPDQPTFATHAIPILTASPIMLLTLMWAGLYVPRRDQRFFRETWLLAKAVAVGAMVTFATMSFLRAATDPPPSRLEFASYAVTAWGGLALWRLAFRTGLRALRRHGFNLRHVAIIGTGRLGQVVRQTLSRNSWTGITPAYFVSHHDVTSREQCLDLPVLGGLDDLEKTLDEREISGVFIALPGRMAATLPDILLRLERYPVDVRVVPDMNPKYMPINMAVTEIDGMPVLSVRQSPLSGWGTVLKRLIDVVGALVALIIFAIPMLVIALLVKRSGDGPVMFRQERMSLNGQRFRIFKFRTMGHVEEEMQTLRDAGRGTEAWTRRDDPRVTSVGRFLRRTSLDELPQLFNVLFGEMSLVGPRPERPELIENFREDWRGYMLRQNVKAGMTGWAQVNGLRGNTSLRKRLQYDLFYVRNWSILFDLRILWMTIFRGFVHPNAQ